MSSNAGPASRWMPYLQWGALTLWMVWGTAPTTIVPEAPTWVVWFVPPAAFTALFAWSSVDLLRGRPPRGWAGWTGYVTVGLVLVLELFYLLVVAAMPGDS